MKRIYILYWEGIEGNAKGREEGGTCYLMERVGGTKWSSNSLDPSLDRIAILTSLFILSKPNLSSDLNSYIQIGFHFVYFCACQLHSGGY